MPTIEEILSREEEKIESEIVMFLEGKFWKAYEQSAYALVKRYGFKPSNRYIKKVGRNIVSVGFPLEAQEKYVSGYVVDGGVLRAKIEEEINAKEFEEWKETLDVKVTSPRKQDGERHRTESGHSRVENLPVFKEAYYLMLDVMEMCNRLTRDFKYTIGEDIKKDVLRIVMSVYRTNKMRGDDVEKRCENLQEALDVAEEVGLKVRILHDLKQISIKRYAYVSENVVEVERHLSQWIEYLLKMK